MPTKSRESIVTIEAIAPRVATMPNRGTDLKELQELRAVKALIEAIVSKAPIESQAAMICKEANAAGSQLIKVR